MIFIEKGKDRPKPPKCPICKSKNVIGYFRDVYMFGEYKGEVLVIWECLDCKKKKMEQI
jgi:ribosomal protein L37AE/L43A